MKLRRPTLFLAIVIVVAFCYDLMFWQKSRGISFAIYVCLLLISGFYLAYCESKKAASPSLWLLFPVLLPLIFTAIRLEPVTHVVSLLLTMTFLVILAHTFRGGRWLSYSLSDYLVIPFRLLESMITRPAQAYRQFRSDTINEGATEGNRKLRLGWTILRGLLFATPVMIVFVALLSSADPIFAMRVEDVIDLFDVHKLFEYLFRGGYILLIAYALAGIYLYMLTASQDEKLLGLEKPVMRPFLGWVEASVILGSVNVLFALFVTVQVRYFFGGDANIHLDGLTYAQYARRGFVELVVVAFFSLVLFHGLSVLTGRNSKLERRVFSALGLLLSILVSVILVSAFQRLQLYEQMYGFTRLRTYTHIFMVWLGIILGTFVLLEVLGRSRGFGLVILLASLGFGLTLGWLNVDGFIAERNFQSSHEATELDLDYLLTLSFDSTPVLVDLFHSDDLNPEKRYQAGGILACQAKELEHELERQSWTGFHFSNWRAWGLLSNMKTELSDYRVVIRGGEYVLIMNEDEHHCSGRWGLD